MATYNPHNPISASLPVPKVLPSNTQLQSKIPHATSPLRPHPTIRPQTPTVGELLLDAFDLDSLDNLLADRLGLRRQRISLARSLDAIVYDLIDDAEMKSYSAELLQAAHAERQTNVGLFRFAQQFALEPSLAEPERLIRSQGSGWEINPNHG